MEFDVGTLNIFGIWFCAFYLIPHIVIFKITSVYPEMITLEGLAVRPCWNDRNNLFYVENNFDVFLNGIKGSAKAKKRNVIAKVLGALCGDIAGGKKHTPELYLSMLKNTYDRFFSTMLLFSFFPVLAEVFIRIFASNSLVLEDLYKLALLQLCCTGLVLFFNMAVRNKYNKFRLLFFSNWYDKLLNFDFIAINDIKMNIRNDSGADENAALPELMSKFIDTNSALNENLKNSTSMLTETLGAFCGKTHDNQFVSYQDMIDTMQSGIDKIADLTRSYEEITGNINKALSAVNEMASTPQQSIQAINNNAALLIEVRDKFANYREQAYIEELDSLKKVTSSLGDTAAAAFKSIDTTVKTTTQNLNESYSRFLELCTKFNETYSVVINSNQIEGALAKLIEENKKLEEYFTKYTATANEAK